MGSGIEKSQSSLSQIGNLTNIQGHECSIDKNDRQKLLNQKGFVTWIAGLSGLGTYLLLFFCLIRSFLIFLGSILVTNYALKLKLQERAQ